jgi:hypothetical protein
MTQAHRTSPPPVIRRSVSSAGEPLTSDELQEAVRLLTRDGFLQVDGVLPADFVTALYGDFLARYATSLSTGRADTVAIATGRYMSAVEMTGAFSDQRLYANVCVLPIVKAALGKTVRLTSFGSVTAAPYAPAQPLHRDHPPLFPESALSGLLPCYALTVVFPLLEIGLASGATAAWLGTHRDGVDVEQLRDEDAFVPEATLGTAYLMDYRLAHRGLANPVDRLRPIMTLVYARPWFSDSMSFYDIPRLNVPAATHASVPDELRALFPSHGRM